MRGRQSHSRWLQANDGTHAQTDARSSGRVDPRNARAKRPLDQHIRDAATNGSEGYLLSNARAYHRYVSARPSSGIDETSAIRAAYLATRRLLAAGDQAAVQSCVDWLCAQLGATPAPADTSDPMALPIDMTIGDGEPMVPVAADSESAQLLGNYLTPLVSDARRILNSRTGAERLVVRATTDPLTGLWNRRSLDMSINRCGPGDCVALLDVDHFKRVNDVHGHEVGDAVLIAFAQHLRANLRDEDIVGRLGGEEFGIVFPRTSLSDATDTLHRLRASWPKSRPLSITFSAGVCPVPEQGAAEEPAGQRALRLADALMYRAKNAGRDRIIAGDDDTHPEQERE